MAVDDHAIISLRTWHDLAYEELKKEWITGLYITISDCPSFKVAAAYHEAMNVLHIGCNYPDVAADQLQKSIDEEIYLKRFWKETKE